MQKMKRTRTNRRKRRSRKNKFLISFVLICVIIGASFICWRLFRHNLEEASLRNGSQSSESDSKDRSIGSADEEEWCLTLVNKWNPMKTDGSEIETVKLSNGERVDKRIYQQLQAMFDAAKADGVSLVVVSGYRTWSEQEKIYNDRIAEYEAEGLSYEEAKEAAELWVAVPGTSEHQLGLAVDINAEYRYSTDDEAYGWLQNHAHEYGFINRYPSDKIEITGIANEPWHYRYVGTRVAGEITSQGICLEEYLEQ